MASSTAFTSAATALRKSAVANSSPGSTMPALASIVRLGFLSLLSRIQLSRSVTICSRNSALASS